MLSIKEIDEIGRLMIPMGPITSNSNNNICSRFAKLCCQAMAYVSLVEKIKAKENASDDAVHSFWIAGYNVCLSEIKSFIGES